MRFSTIASMINSPTAEKDSASPTLLEMTLATTVQVQLVLQHTVVLVSQSCLSVMVRFSLFSEETLALTALRDTSARRRTHGQHLVSQVPRRITSIQTLLLFSEILALPVLRVTTRYSDRPIASFALKVTSVPR